MFWIQVFIVCKYNDIILYRGFALLLKETYIGNHRFVDQKFSFKRNWFDYLFCVFLISKMLCICQFSPSSSQRLFRNIGGFRTKKYSADHWTGNIYYSVIFRYKRYFSGLLFFWPSGSDDEFPRDCFLHETVYLRVFKIEN